MFSLRSLVLWGTISLSLLASGCVKGSGGSTSSPSSEAQAASSSDTSSSSSGSQSSTASCTNQTGFFSDLFNLTNTKRQEAGLSPLSIASSLVQTAQSHAVDMANNNYFSHTALDGSSVGDRARRFGYQNLVGENIGAGYESPEAVIEGWMNSPGHRENILDPRYTEIGFGFFSNSASEYGNYWVQVFGINPNVDSSSAISPIPSDFEETCTIAQSSNQAVLNNSPGIHFNNHLLATSVPESNSILGLILIGGSLMMFYYRKD